MKIHADKVFLKREEANFKAAFCVINEELPELLKQTSILHPEEKTYYESLKYDRRRKSYLLGRIAAKQAVFKLLNNEPMDSFSVAFGVFYFPVVKYIQNQNIQVSITHCNNIGVALAYPEEHPLGIDVEKIDQENTETMKSLIMVKEYNLISSCALELSIGSTLIWTIKEALSKVLKTGLTLDFKILEIESIEKVGECYISSFMHFSQYKAVSKQIGTHICTVVLPKNTFCNFNVFWEAFEASASKK